MSPSVLSPGTLYFNWNLNYKEGLVYAPSLRMAKAELQREQKASSVGSEDIPSPSLQNLWQMALSPGPSNPQLCTFFAWRQPNIQHFHVTSQQTGLFPSCVSLKELR